MKKKINFKPASDVRASFEEEIDQWVKGEPIGSREKKEDVQQLEKEQEQSILDIENKESLKQKGELYRISLDIPKYLHRRIKKVCVNEGVSMKNKITELFLREFPEK